MWGGCGAPSMATAQPARCFIPLLALGLGACSSSDTGQGVRGPVPSPWWYQDYYYYWDDYYPWCCDNQGEFDELIKKWWSGLDPERQQEIREKYQDWQENPGQPDVAALRGDLASRWHAMTPAQQQKVRAAAQDAARYNNENRIKDEKDVVEYFKAQGLKIVTPNVDEFRKVVQAKYLNSEYAGIWPKGLLERLNAVR